MRMQTGKFVAIQNHIILHSELASLNVVSQFSILNSQFSITNCPVLSFSMRLIGRAMR